MDSPAIRETVRAFYQRHPYPQPVENLDRYRARWSDPERRRADFHLFEPDKPYREDRSVLVAGCGTSQAAKYAIRWPQACVTGIDISPTSIAETLKLKHAYGLDNLEVHELAVEEAGALNSSYDHVVCTGVLHHLADPNRGLAALSGVLGQQGSMHVMVYAPYGRAGIYLIQDYCRRLGIGTSSSEIRQLAESLQALPSNHPLVPLIRNSPDFAQEASLADALLNPQDRPYSVEQFFALLEGADLRFGRWIRQAGYLPGCGSLGRSPHRGRIADLPPVEQFAAVELFRGTILRHSAMVTRSDCGGCDQPIQFADGKWPSLVPLREPDTICVRERLPEGAAGVLINQTHSHPDLYLPIDKTQERLFNAVDNQRNLGEIADETGDRVATRDFFQILWEHDQIVLDGSRVPASDEGGK